MRYIDVNFNFFSVIIKLKLEQRLLYPFICSFRSQLTITKLIMRIGINN